MNHVVHFSGGAGSWLAARRVRERFGAGNLTLLTADTGSEAADWHEFVDAAAEDIGGEYVKLPPVHPGGLWELAENQRMIPSSRAGFCSRILKMQPSDNYINEHFSPETSVRYFGFDCYEDHRLERMRRRLEGWNVEAPLLWDPPLDKHAALEALKATDLPYPAAYELDLPHNNCLASGCFKGGQAYWKRFAELFPKRFAETERNEQEFQAKIGKPVTILRRQVDGRIVPLSLTELRERHESQGQLDLDDYGACGCYI